MEVTEISPACKVHGNDKRLRGFEAFYPGFLVRCIPNRFI
jgi:hypothetical protein